MLAYSVFSLRLSEDVPSQSDSIHLISFYLTTCMFFSLSAMTWFAITNKLREKQQLPHWLRWLALDYICWIVCAKSMHRKAVRAAKQQYRTLSMRSSTPVTVPLKSAITTNSADCTYSSNQEQISLRKTKTNKDSIRLLKSHRLLHPPTSNTESFNEILSTPTIWIRRPSSETQATTSNGLENRRKKYSSEKFHQSNEFVSRANQESLYAIHIINRFVFLVFLITVIIINIYTWFFYSRTIQTKLSDNQTLWTCFDESRLQVINCNATYS